MDGYVHMCGELLILMHHSPCTIIPNHLNTVYPTTLFHFIALNDCHHKGPFLTGAVCANLAWLTIWPLDVVKTQLQSGKYAGKSPVVLVTDVWRSGLLFRGLVPGLTRSTMANGLSMVVYKKVEALLLDKK
jgi:hypothetical protein